MEYQLHPLCTLFPRMSGADLDALREDVAANGLRQPIVLHDGMILDGGNRYRACLDAGIEPVFEEYDGGNLVSFVLSANLHRRHMTPGQQAAIVASAQDWAAAQGIGRPEKGSADPISTVAGRAAQSGASIATQKRADRVAKADPELAKKVAHGETSLPAAVEQITGTRPGKSKRTIAPPLEAVPSSNDELAEARHAITDLAAENEALRDRLAVEQMDADEEGKAEAASTIAELRERVRTLEAENDALKASRDTYMQKVSEMQKQVAYWRKQAEKAA
ncbi:ParB/RepB/Spo0J family partition protein [Achromobacter xylosoxidans]|uniref:ParB/RepB/Spo0J family partition protein n=1 Tax=Alcaligenes xylosoxydans xylosoxydans TaxID=85698 RepID=UPI0006C65C40|nr:S-adenosylmethionine-binding protein [Achromobacter xylosoxidans]MCH4571958.1 S-adenosylmethionine-binding protein [Achromobacter xylosoxidans]NEV03867.1 S-adenosylmethionine-binding protein [Achromobacter xylosoxidans]CUK21935.1 Uncharacterised protein [Achromobacter xylosoxidans]